jgi:hypothetical protein
LLFPTNFSPIVRRKKTAPKLLFGRSLRPAPPMCSHRHGAGWLVHLTRLLWHSAKFLQSLRDAIVKLSSPLA